MALTTLTNYKAFAGITDTTNDVSLSTILAEVDAAVKQLCRPFLLEPTTLTLPPLDAPYDSPDLVLPVVPCRSVTSVYLNATANGDPTAFTADYLLTPYTDYYLVIDDPVNNYSRAGILRRRASVSWWGAPGAWATEGRRPFNRLAWEPTAARGCVQVTGTFGPAAVPSNVALAAHLLTSKVFNSRKLGGQVTSASLNGGSYSLPGPMTAQGLLGDPSITALLAPYMSLSVGAP